MDELKACPFTRKEKMAVNNLKIDNGNGAYILKRDADVILHYIKFLQSEVERLSAEPENEALSLEELRQMDGEPVWIKILGKPDLDCWGFHDEDGVCGYTCFPHDDDYGKTWLAYARKPDFYCANGKRKDGAK